MNVVRKCNFLSSGFCAEHKSWFRQAMDSKGLIGSPISVRRYHDPSDNCALPDPISDPAHTVDLVSNDHVAGVSTPGDDVPVDTGPHEPHVGQETADDVADAVCCEIEVHVAPAKKFAQRSIGHVQHARHKKLT